MMLWVGHFNPQEGHIVCKDLSKACTYLYIYINKKDWFTVCHKSEELQFINILSANKVAILRTVDLLYLLNCIIETI